MNPTHYIGKTRHIASVLLGKLPKLQRGDGEVLDRCLLFSGLPGNGKSTLAVDLAAAISGDTAESIRRGASYATEYVNGQSCTIEAVRKWRDSQCYRPLGGTGTGVILVDEIDGASLAACNELRTLLDRLHPGRVFIATTNKTYNELQTQLHSRFKLYRFEPVPEEEIAAWLHRQFPTLTLDLCRDIAQPVEGNVRAARCDALAMLEALEVV